MESIMRQITSIATTAGFFEFSVQQVAMRLLERLDVSRQRRTLRNLDAAALSDIGLTRAEAVAEASRPFWK